MGGSGLRQTCREIWQHSLSRAPFPWNWDACSISLRLLRCQNSVLRSWRKAETLINGCGSPPADLPNRFGLLHFFCQLLLLTFRLKAARSVLSPFSLTTNGVISHRQRRFANQKDLEPLSGSMLKTSGKIQRDLCPREKRLDFAQSTSTETSLFH